MPQHNKLKEYKHMVARTRRELKGEKDQAVAQRLRYTDWNKELQDRIVALRAEQKNWMSEAASMRAAEKEAKVSIACCWFIRSVAHAPAVGHFRRSGKASGGGQSDGVPP